MDDDDDFDDGFDDGFLNFQFCRQNIYFKTSRG